MDASGAATTAIIPSTNSTVMPRGPPIPATPPQPSLVKRWQEEEVWEVDEQIMVAKALKGTEAYDGTPTAEHLPKLTFYFVCSSLFTHVWEAFVLTPHTFSGRCWRSL